MKALGHHLSGGVEPAVICAFSAGATQKAYARARSLRYAPSVAVRNSQ
jgi:hypothetical protein